MEEKKTDLEKFKENVEQYNQGKDQETNDTPRNDAPDNEKPNSTPSPRTCVKP